MDEFKVKHLPVIENGYYIGLVSDDMIFDYNSLKDPLNKLNFIGNQHMVSLIHIFTGSCF